MTTLTLLGIVAGVSVVLALLLRVNAVFLFLSAAAGNLLARSVADDADLALGTVVTQGDTALYARIGLQVLPVLLTLFFLRKTIPVHKVLIHVLPIIATGLMLAVLVLPMLPTDMRTSALKTPYGDWIENAQDVVVGVAAVLTLLLAWFGYRHPDAKAGKRHK